MSTPVRPARTDAASMTAIRGLLERNLLERAVALAETRWPGSGPVVELAHEWTALSPSARRERLASIGPEELARLRGVSQLQPDLARVLDDLEARGIIPPEHVAADDGADEPITEAPPAKAPQSFEEAVTDAALDYSEQGLQRLARSVREDLPPQLEAALATGNDEAVAAATVAAAAELARERAVLDPMKPVAMPELDLGLPSAEEFLAKEAERRLQANELANSILERARSRVDDVVDRLLPASDSVTPTPTVEPELPMPAPTPVLAESAAAPQSTRVDFPVDARVDRALLSRIEREQILELQPGDPLPADADLRAAASASHRDYVELRPDRVGAREFFGGLVREGRRIEPRAGAFPTAVSRRCLVVVYGRLYPKTIERLRAGYCDIPGTQATVRVHPECRIVLLPE